MLQLHKAINLYFTTSDCSISNYSAVGSFRTSGTTGVFDMTLPTEFPLDQNYPKTFNPETEISFSLSKEGIKNYQHKIYLAKILQHLLMRSYVEGFISSNSMQQLHST